MSLSSEEPLVRSDADLVRQYAAGEREFSGIDLPGADLRGSLLGLIQLQGANLKGANLLGAYLRGANLKEINLSGADLSGANLRDADLSGADLVGTKFLGANLRGADLRQAQLEGTFLSGAVYDQTTQLDPEVDVIDLGLREFSEPETSCGLPQCVELEWE